LIPRLAQIEQELHAADAVFLVRFLGHACSLVVPSVWQSSAMDMEARPAAISALWHLVRIDC
jgi:hypothetical protein